MGAEGGFLRKEWSGMDLSSYNNFTPGKVAKKTSSHKSLVPTTRTAVFVRKAKKAP